MCVEGYVLDSDSIHIIISLLVYEYTYYNSCFFIIS